MGLGQIPSSLEYASFPQFIPRIQSVSRGLLPQVLLLFIPAKTELRARLRRFARVEEGTSLEERICLPKSGPTQPAYLNGKNGLENDLEASWRDSISDLQLASRLLYSSQRGRPGCCSAARHAPHEPRNQASLPIGNGRAGPNRS